MVNGSLFIVHRKTAPSTLLHSARAHGRGQDRLLESKSWESLQMVVISQNANKYGFFAISGRNSGEMESEFHYNLKKQTQMPAFGWKY
jgi:hypothetical protein